MVSTLKDSRSIFQLLDLCSFRCMFLAGVRSLLAAAAAATAAATAAAAGAAVGAAESAAAAANTSNTNPGSAVQAARVEG